MRYVSYAGGGTVVSGALRRVCVCPAASVAEIGTGTSGSAGGRGRLRVATAAKKIYFSWGRRSGGHTAQRSGLLWGHPR